jgi:MinD-like ATPase involved in chromosome partitioning or flagellar assembly
VSKSIYFDDSIPEFAKLVIDEWGREALKENLFLRDITGKITFVVTSPGYRKFDRNVLSSKVSKSLRNYVDQYVIATPEELFDDRLYDFDAAHKISISVQGEKTEVLIVDRRMVGADWLRDISSEKTFPRRFVFSSIKGGVGRSTALCVLASHLATIGMRVLTVDMDLEAPGIGNMLLPDDTLPPFGLLDYLVERGLSNVDDQFLVDMVGASWLGGGVGRVDVIPAIGQRSIDNPGNVLSKIARAYLDGEGNSGVTSFMDHLSQLLDRFSNENRYDVILVDARAGLHETTATAILGLGADILFFGVDQPQTLYGYQFLLANLAEFQKDRKKEIAGRIYFIHSKASESLKKRDLFSFKIQELIRRYLGPAPREAIRVDVEQFKESFDVEWSDDLSPDVDLVIEELTIPVCAILNDARFGAFDPVKDRDSLLESVYKTSYGEFLKMISETLEI